MVGTTAVEKVKDLNNGDAPHRRSKSSNQAVQEIPPDRIFFYRWLSGFQFRPIVRIR